ncbi:MAG: hypothetical protein FIA95_14525 [Gemmatimonadetes bacterium]|nr:hypothetical protein [Gemmatimonadota bacterium]
MQGRLWRRIGLSWVGSLILVVPLMWELTAEQPFWSLGPFGGNWQAGMAIAALGALVLVAAFWGLFRLMLQGAGAAEAGFGTLTIVEVMSDVGRDMGFLIQGRRWFAYLGDDERCAVVLARLRWAAFLLAAALWLPVGFGLSVLLAARGLLTPSGVLLVTLGPIGLLILLGLAVLGLQRGRLRAARRAWVREEGADRITSESGQWLARLESAGSAVALGSGPKGEAARFRTGAAVVALLFVASLVPAATVAVTAAIGPILAEIAVPTFLSVQEMAGAAETLRRFRLPADPGIMPGAAGAALQNLAFVGDGAPEPWEQAPARKYETGWFPNPQTFPDPFSETVARDLMLRPLAGLTEDEQAALRQAAAHPAHEELRILARAQLMDVVSGRWTLPFPDTLSFQELPWARFAAFRTAGLAHVAKAAVQMDGDDREGVEETLAELVSAGFLLMDQGPTLVDNLMGVVLADMGADALEGYYVRVGRDADAQALRWAREAAADAARKARAGLLAEEIHALLQGIPQLVEQEDALRGLRWEYFATFNTLAPCINVHKMVFGPDDTYDEWRVRVRDQLVRVRGERDLFALAEGNAFGAGRPRELRGFLARFLGMTMGSRGSPGSCASLIAQFQRTGGI